VSHGRSYWNPKKTAIAEACCHAGLRGMSQNDAGTRAADWHKSGTACSLTVPTFNPDTIEAEERAAIQQMPELFGGRNAE
jgi:hypothetical protein